MKKLVIIAVIVIAALAGVAFYSGVFRSQQAQAAGQNQAGQDQGAGQQAGGGRGRRGGGGGGGNGGGFGGGGGFGRPPMTVETTIAHKQSIAEEVTVVGNLIGDATVLVAPRAAGRLQDVFVRLGDRVGMGQRLAKIEDFEIVEQVKQADAAQDVSAATIRQREADLKLAETSVERSRSLYQRQLLPKQTLDDNEARYQAAVAQLDLARAQNAQSKARIDELKINLANTLIQSPVNGFVSKRLVDPGAFVNQNAPIVEVVDITRVRLVVNVVEKDLKQLAKGDAANTQVDAFPGETFKGRIARVSPVLDPSTRTAPIEIEIPNADYRLKPGMYARVGITTATKKDALVLPANAVIDLGGRRGVFLPQPDNTAVFRQVQPGTEQLDVVEIIDGINEGDRVITTGAGGLRDGDRIVLAGGGGGRGRRGQAGGDATQGGGQSRGGDAPASSQFGARSGQGGDSQVRRGGDGQQFRGSGDGQSRRGGEGQFPRGDGQFRRGGSQQ
jgi:RND family efflux transporter MFP subunit